jgi:anti-sigma factor RsiW
MADGTAISCQEVVEVITDYLEGKLSPEDAAIFEAHLELCDGCKWYLEQMRTTIATVGHVEEEEVPAELRDTVLAAFTRARARERT